MSGGMVLLLGLDDGIARMIAADCSAFDLVTDRRWPTTQAPLLCIARADTAAQLFDVQQRFPECLLAVVGEPTSHTYPNEAIWLRHPVRTAALRTLIEMVASPSPLDDDELTEIRNIFWDRYHSDLAHFEQWLSDGKFKELQRIGHQIAGSAATLGYPNLGMAGRRLEDAATHANIAVLRESLEELRRYARE